MIKNVTYRHEYDEEFVMMFGEGAYDIKDCFEMMKNNTYYNNFDEWKKTRYEDGDCFICTRCGKEIVLRQVMQRGIDDYILCYKCEQLLWKWLDECAQPATGIPSR